MKTARNFSVRFSTAEPFYSTVPLGILRVMKKFAGIATAALLITCAIGAAPLSALASFNGVLPVTTTSVLTPTVTLGSSTLTLGHGTTVTISFPAVPANFSAANMSATNGTLSGFSATGDPKVFTVVYTPTSVSSTNAVTVAPTVSTATYTGLTDTPGAMAFDGTNMWVAYENSSSGHISKVAPNGTVTTTGGLDISNAIGLFAQDDHASIAFDGTNMWVGAANSNFAAYKLDKVSPTGTVSSYTANADISGLAYDGTKIWAGNGQYGTSGQGLSTFSSTGVETTVLTGNSEANDVAFDGTNMWTANLHAGSISKVAPNGTVLGSYAVTCNPHFISFNGTTMWYSDTNAAEVGWSTLSGSTHLYSTGSYKLGKLVSDGTNMWGGDELTGTLVRVAPDGSYIAFPVLSGNSNAVAFDGTSLWSANSDGSMTKVTPMVAASSANFTVNAASAGRGRSAAVVSIFPAAVSGSLGFSVASSSANHETLDLNANPSTVSGYSASLDPGFMGGMILPYPASGIATLDLPSAAGTYTIYMVYVSPTGNHSPVMSHTVTVGAPGLTANTLPGAVAAASGFARTLSPGSQGADVSSLQSVLVKDGELVMPAGATYGSFGARTQKALEAFQEKYALATEGSAGYGIFGPKTQAKATTLQAGN